MTLPLAALADTHAPQLSSRYQFISTQTIIERFAEENWHVETAYADKPRKRNNAFTKHVIDFRNPELKPVNGAVPRILFVNSHDGTSRAKVLAGMFSFACENGLVVGTTAHHEAVRHTGDAAVDLVSRMREIARSSADLCNVIERWSKTQLTKPQRRQFALFAAQLRWGNAQLYSPDSLLEVLREEDDRGDLWATFNVIQEHTVRGGAEGVSRTGRMTRARPLNDITRSLDYNSQLWRLAEEVSGW